MNNLPTPEQLENYRLLRGWLQDQPVSVSEEDKKAFCRLILGMCPGAIDTDDIDLMQKLWPDEWRRYCDEQWGTPEEQQELKDGELLAQGWVRGPDGEMCIPFP